MVVELMEGVTLTEARERDTVRALAYRVAEIAHSAENEHRRRLWRDVNGLRGAERPPVLVRLGQGALKEALPRSVVTSQHPYLAGIEYTLRQALHKHELADDSVVETWMGVPAVVRLQGEHLWGLPVRHFEVQDDSVLRTAWRYDPPIKTEADIERIVPPRYQYDPVATQQRLERMDDLLGDILPVRRICAIPGAGAWLHGWATQLRGLEPLMLDLMERPAWVHRLMRTLMEGHLGVLDQFEQMGLLTPNNLNYFACDDLPQPDYDGERLRLRDLWGRGESQEFQGVSPAQHEEFLLQYQRPILERFGLTYYGCCEDLTRKIPLILTVPHLRRFTCSPWTDLEQLAAAVGDRYCIEWRQKATDVVYATDLGVIRDDLERGLRAAQGCHIMIILQELETTNGNPQRLADWVALAKDTGARLAA